MKDVVLITGATGHLAQFLSDYLSNDYEVRLLTTKKRIVDSKRYFYWDVKTEYIDCRAIENCKYVIHLAGYSILNRWTVNNKRMMYESRVNSTNLLLQFFVNQNIQPEAFICASAMGIYKESHELINEGSEFGSNWLANMAKDWERAANQFNDIGTRVVQMRISLIFSRKYGFLKYNICFLKFGLGMILGNSERKINWIHIDDMARFIKMSLYNKHFRGAYNLASAGKLSQKEFFSLIRKGVFRYSIILKIPAFFVRLLLGERAQILLSNFDLCTRKIQDMGFVCEYDDIYTLINYISSKES